MEQGPRIRLRRPVFVPQSRDYGESRGFGVIGYPDVTDDFSLSRRKVGRVTPERAGNHLTLRDTNLKLTCLPARSPLPVAALPFVSPIPSAPLTNAHEFGYKISKPIRDNSCASCLPQPVFSRSCDYFTTGWHFDATPKPPFDLQTTARKKVGRAVLLHAVLAITWRRARECAPYHHKVQLNRG
jgi:hypothetical protein